jgi:hypothetical protein
VRRTSNATSRYNSGFMVPGVAVGREHVLPHQELLTRPGVDGKPLSGRDRPSGSAV